MLNLSVSVENLTELLNCDFLPHSKNKRSHYLPYFAQELSGVSGSYAQSCWSADHAKQAAVSWPYIHC